MPIIYNRPLYDSLKELKVISQEKLDEVMNKSIKSNSFLGDALLDENLISDKDLGQVIANVINLPFINLSETDIKSEVLNVVPRDLAQKEFVISFDRNDLSVKLAMNNPFNQDVIAFISKKTNQKVEIFYATKASIRGALKYYQKDLQEAFDKLIEKETENAEKTSDDLPIANILNLLIQYAYQNRASDIHIEPWEKFTLIRFRIDGILHDVLQIPSKLHDNIISKIKLLAKLRTDEHASAQDGKIHMEVENEDLDVRVSIIPVVRGEEAELRLLSASSQEISLNTIGLSEKDLEAVKDGFNKPFGMVLSTGPTGSGKTTTIYTILKVIDVHKNNIDTIEDPVEYNIEGVNQIQVNNQTNLTFAKGLRAILRQDPNIIFVGEIRDSETAQIAVNSAMTGHLVLSTLHTNNSSTTLPRLLEMGIEPFLVASTINIIIGQKLVRKICTKCIYSENVPIDKIARYVSPYLIDKYFKDKEEMTFYKGKGCSICQSIGYTGRIGIFEVLKMSKGIKDLVISKADADRIYAKAMEEGMTSMLEDGLVKAMKGITSLDEILRVTKE